MIFNLDQWLIYKGIEETAAVLIANAAAVVMVLLVSILAFIVTKQVFLRILAFYIHRNKILWDDKLLGRKVFRRLAHMIPAIVIYAVAGLFPEYSGFIQKIAIIYIIVAGTLAMLALLDAIDDIYRTFEASRFKPIRSIVQALKIVVWLIGGIWMIATMIDRSPLLLLSGIGAVTAIILLIFKDSLLGLVAGIQLSSNDMLRIGDWIEMPKYGADGDVTDISLNTVKVRNFDNTITTIPSYALISDSFKNWRGMQESGGRRIKRSIFIDSSSIRFCTDDMLAKFKEFRYLSEYIENKKRELEKYNLEHNIDPAQLVNGRRLTNIGTFRAYLQTYLENHPEIHPEMTRMARQLPVTEYGIPIEIYAFTKDTSWESYETVQADIFDHILAIVPEFELRIYQSPTGYDLRHMGL
ncbi:mechanosensitive ion channel family protein [Dehalobacter sp. TBBPA1]|uniref:mechanosensitive ion channel family protein n=1 Tax=Dehalobacter sp. TBBPA1 TaxID=3235037 RepID=UPI0034A4AF5E|nr:mechanosensitive ion channel family protein [Dehalobacter sp.]